MALLGVATTHAADYPREKQFTNSIGISFQRIEAGKFEMGQIKTPLPWQLMPVTGGRGDRMNSLLEGDWDEKPVHPVKITRPYYIGAFEVKNFQYELFDPAHRALRGKEGLSKADDEAVINVSWYEAEAFCRWLSEREGLPYRLPTEAEWEYACRAGTTDNYFMGESLPKTIYKDQRETKDPEPMSLRGGETPPNAWGLFDMHGNLEEWCHDWYGPYKPGLAVDPVGYADGEFRVTRSGSRGTQAYYLRSANRLGALPETRNWVTGFRVVLGEMPATKPLPPLPPPLHQQKVVERERKLVSKGPDLSKPYFKGPRKYVKIPNGSNGPLFASHNHDPSIVECPNGDLLTVWYTCDSERNRELAIAASRLRYGQEEWDEATPFFDVPDRNDHAPVMGFDGKHTIYFFTGVSFAAEHGAMALAMRTSKDSGATWTKARLVMPEFNHDHMPSEPVLWLNDGTLTFAQDGPKTLWMSRDAGLTWFNPGGNIRGVHPSVVQLKDGTLYGLGRGSAIEGKMPRSISTDLGKTFGYSASEFPPIGGGQRLVLMRLKEGPLFFASFADGGFTITDSSGQQRLVRGVFAAVSHDEGKTWSHKRLVTDDGPARPVEGSGGRLFVMSGSNAEESGYMAGCQGLDGVIHLITSREHYAFNLKWIMTAPPPLQPDVPVKAVTETFKGPKDFDTPGWAIRKSFTGGFKGRGRYTINSATRSCGINRMVGKGLFECVVAVDNLVFLPADGRTEPAFIFSVTDASGPGVSLRLGHDRLSLNEGKEGVAIKTPPKSAKLKIVYTENNRQCRIFYGLDGEDAIHELPQSQAGFFLKEPFSQHTTVNLVQDHGSVDLVRFEIKSL